MGAIGFPRHRRQPGAKDILNSKLDYGFAVMAGLCHRSIVIHGLNPVFGVHHRARYRAAPLVYDLMEPLRAFIEQALYDFYAKEGSKKESAEDMQKWCKFCANSYKNIHVQHKSFPLKLVDAVDYYISSAARAFAQKDTALLWIPKMVLEE